MILYSRRFLNSRPLETPEGVRAAPIPTIRWVTYHTCRYPECVMPTKSVPCSTISDHTSNSVMKNFTQIKKVASIIKKLSFKCYD